MFERERLCKRSLRKHDIHYVHDQRCNRVGNWQLQLYLPRDRNQSMTLLKMILVAAIVPPALSALVTVVSVVCFPKDLL